MINVNENQFLACEFGNQLAAYLYDEIDETEKSNFETHLSGCEICADELTDFSVLRSSIINWRQTDFEPLETPVFVLPAAREIKAEPRSWFAAVKAFFAISPARATVFAAVAVLLFSAALFWFSSRQSQSSEVAKVENQRNEINFQKKENDEQISSPVADATPRTSDKSSNTTKTALPVKNSVAPAKVSTPATMKSQTIQQIAPNQNPRVKTPSKNAAPALENEDEDEDNSLRLSDMFDEIGMNSPAENDSEDNVNNE